MEIQKPVAEISSLLNITLEEISTGLGAGAFTSLDLVNAYLRRIEEVNDEFHAVLEVNPDGLSIAKDLDHERSVSGSRGPLHGVPVLVKDNVVTRDKLEASAGSYALLGAKPAQEASVIARLRTAGAIILGKTNLSEWTNWRSTMSSSGWSPRGGQTTAVYQSGSQATGSSGGSAVAAALGLCSAAIGTETSGSVIRPAESNAVVGLRPTRALIANDGCVPCSRRQDVVCPLTRTVKDAAQMLNIIAGRSEADYRTRNIPFRSMPDFTKACRQTDLKGFTVGVPKPTFFGIKDASVMKAFELGLKALASAGAQITENVDLESMSEYTEMIETSRPYCIAAEFKSNLVQYLATLENNPHGIRNVKDLIAFTKTSSQEEYPERDIEKFLWSEAKDCDICSRMYSDAMDKMSSSCRDVKLAAADFDVLVVPGTTERLLGLAAHLGYPTISIPLGFYPASKERVMNRRGNLIELGPGIPFSITLTSKAYNDARLLQVAYAFEQLTQVRKTGPPLYKVPRTEIKDIRS